VYSPHSATIKHLVLLYNIRKNKHKKNKTYEKTNIRKEKHTESNILESDIGKSDI
jgi:hypothetical protein